MSETSPQPFEHDINLAPYNTLHVEARAKAFVSIRSVRQLQDVLRNPKIDIMPVFVLGGGSNILFVDDFDGLILHVAIGGREIVRENETYVWLRIGAGENWHQTVVHCVEMGWGGIENLSLIPGTVGAAPIQNIGAYGVELEEVFHSLEAVEISTGSKRIFSKTECQFSYRNSIFKNELKGKYVVTHVELKLSKNPELNTSYGAIQSKLEEKGIAEPDIRDVSEIVIEIRNSKLPDPKDLANAGSFFKNPVIPAARYLALKSDYADMPGYAAGEEQVKVPAGWLIEKTGWKGKVTGRAGTYKQQALVIVNHGGATGREILELAKKIRSSVVEEFGIELVPEVNILG